MSEPESGNEGDDILKSIRRLVSVEDDGAFRSDRPADAPGDRLVLTDDMSVECRDEPLLKLSREAADDPADPAADPALQAALEAETLQRTADATGLDEAALRALISEIVRDELRGALGQRITRDIRKLIRREILRAQALLDAE